MTTEEGEAIIALLPLIRTPKVYLDKKNPHIYFHISITPLSEKTSLNYLSIQTNFLETS